MNLLLIWKNSTHQVFDLRSLTWSSLKLKTESSSGENTTEEEDVSLREAFPAISDHRMVSPLHEEEFL